MNEKPRMICEICLESFEYDENDMRPWIYHEGKNGMHCAGKNPSWKHTKRQYQQTTTTSLKLKDHILHEYFNYGYKKKVDDDDAEEIQEENRII
jgi:hypothetical protein